MTAPLGSARRTPTGGGAFVRTTTSRCVAAARVVVVHASINAVESHVDGAQYGGAAQRQIDRARADAAKILFYYCAIMAPPSAMSIRSSSTSLRHPPVRGVGEG